MAFPPEFKYANEDDFIQRFLIPLLQRLGFGLVVNYHGSTEFGKDLIVGEIDRFGHVRYHGVQAKYEASISLNEVESLISDCKQAFANPFTHPQTGTVERISSFYAMNGGSLGPEAVSHYFNSLRPAFGGNVQLLQGKDLLTLDRWAALNRANDVRERIAGLILELDFNSRVSKIIQSTIDEKMRPIERFRLIATSDYLRAPSMSHVLDPAIVDKYWLLCDSCNTVLDATGRGKLSAPRNRDDLTADVVQKTLPAIRKLEMQIRLPLVLTSQQLGPLSQL